jgi:hypothetical protein
MIINFKKLCKKCDSLLNDNIQNIALNAISYLHVLRAHPEILRKYFFFSSKKKNNDQSNFYLISLAKKILDFLVFIITNEKLLLYSKQTRKIDCLIISHLINKDHLIEKKDFYFGSLQSRLSNYRLSSLIALRNFTGKNLRTLSKLPFDKKHHKVILSSFFKINSEIKIILLFLNEFFRIKILKKSVKNFSLLKKIGKIKYLTSIFSNIRISEQVIFLIKLHQPKYLFFTYEGHAWERIVIKKVKEFFPNIKIIAYQFSIISKHHHSMFRPLNKIYNPDIIMTSGSITADLFKRKKLDKTSKILIYGSDKFTRKAHSNFPEKSILILPEGFCNETKILFNFCILASTYLPDFKFYFRLHPLINKNVFFKKNCMQKISDNLIISNDTLEKDFKKSKYAIYRGSATIIEAVNFGLIPIYYGQENEISLNPLFKFEKKPFKIQNIIDLNNTLKINFKLEKLRKVRGYCRSFFQQPNSATIKSIFKKN